GNVRNVDWSFLGNNAAGFCATLWSRISNVLLDAVNALYQDALTLWVCLDDLAHRALIWARNDNHHISLMNLHKIRSPPVQVKRSSWTSCREVHEQQGRRCGYRVARCLSSK